MLPTYDLQKMRFEGIVDEHGRDHYNDITFLSFFGPEKEDRRLDLAVKKAAAAMTTQANAITGRRGRSLLGDCVDPEHRSDLIMPTFALENWQRSGVKGRARRKLVIVATSGGAYRAAYWTSLVLDELTRQSKPNELVDRRNQLEGINDSIKLITGASGGMVAGAYYAALAQDRRDGAHTSSVETTLDQDILTYNDPGAVLDGRRSTGRDSLTNVAKHLLMRDLPNMIWPFGGKTDRGIALQSQWTTLNNTSFHDLVAGEKEGWRPSIIFSPMLVETGQPLLISNLNLKGMQPFNGNQTEIFFDLFPCSQQTFTAATAVRMNATFPYISPAVSLPTKPERRVVDAGYFDNYGISTAAAYLSDPKVRRWIDRTIDDVILIEIRAFPTGLSGELACAGKQGERNINVDEIVDQVKNPALASSSIGASLAKASSGGTTFEVKEKTVDEQEVETIKSQVNDVFQDWISHYSETGSRLEQFEWLSNPVEAAVSARSASMVFRNSQAMDKVRSLYEHTRISSVVFVNNTGASLNWHLSESEMSEMRACFNNQWTSNYQTLLGLWNAEPIRRDVLARK